MAGVAELKAAAERLVHELEGLLDREKHVALLFEGHKADLTALVDAVEKVHSDAVAAVATPPEAEVTVEGHPESLDQADALADETAAANAAVDAAEPSA